MLEQMDWQYLKKFSTFAIMMNKMTNHLTNILTGVALVALSTGCDSHGGSAASPDFKVTFRLEGKQQHDSATLLVLEEEYQQLRVCGTTPIKAGCCSFTGQTECPKVAIIRWDNDSTQPFYFVLEQGNIDITIGNSGWTITGSPMNSKYLHYINQRNSIMDARVATWQEYLKKASTGSIKRDEELRLVRQDSVLNDSLQRITVECINHGDAVGRILRERYAKQLDQDHMRQLK